MIAGCTPAAPNSSPSDTAAPTPNLQATIAAAIASATGSTPLPTATITPTVTLLKVNSQPKNTDGPSSTAMPDDASTPLPTPSFQWIATPRWMGDAQNAVSVEAPAAANDVVAGWLMDFTHTNPAYLNQARSAFAHFEDDRPCTAAEKFEEIVDASRDYDGERLPAASYNAGVIYLDIYLRGYPFCLKDGSSRETLEQAIENLEYTWRHRNHTGFDADISLLLGTAYSHSSAEGSSEQAIEFLCIAAESDQYRERAKEMLAGLNDSC